jgi:hypothetical protein
MDNNTLTVHMATFNDRVRAMNQMNRQELRLTAVEANNLLSDMFAVLAQVSQMTQQMAEGQNQVVQVQLSGGGFK